MLRLVQHSAASSSLLELLCALLSFSCLMAGTPAGCHSQGKPFTCLHITYPSQEYASDWARLVGWLVLTNFKQNRYILWDMHDISIDKEPTRPGLTRGHLFSILMEDHSIQYKELVLCWFVHRLRLLRDITKKTECRHHSICSHFLHQRMNTNGTGTKWFIFLKQ